MKRNETTETLGDCGASTPARHTRSELEIKFLEADWWDKNRLRQYNVPMQLC